MNDTIDPTIFDEILRNTDRANYINKHERVLRKTLVELVRTKKATFLFLRDDETRDVWNQFVKQATKTVEETRSAWKTYDIKQAAWDRLSEEERKILVIRKPHPPKRDRI